MANFNCACLVSQRGQGSGFLSEGSSWLTACMSEQRRFWQDCANAQARLNLRCSHIRQVPNSLDAVHLFILSHHISLVTLTVAGATQTTFQKYLSTCPCLPLSSGIHRKPLISIFDVVFPFLHLSFSHSCSFYCRFRTVFAMAHDLKMWLYHLSFGCFTMVRRSSCAPSAQWTLLRTSSFVMYL